VAPATIGLSKLRSSAVPAKPIAAGAIVTGSGAGERLAP
jgi:hypothetical protein